MIRALLSRLALSLIAVLGAALFTFAMLRVAPGDPARLVLGPFASEEAVAALRAEMGIGQPLVRQFLIYVGDFITGNWGWSYGMGDSVRNLLADRFPATIELGLAAFVLAVALAVPLAALTVHRAPSRLGKPVHAVAMFALGVPQFWFGLMLLIVGASLLGIFPGPEGRLGPTFAAPPRLTGLYTVDALAAGDVATALDALRHLVLPAATLGLLPFGFLLRLLAANLRDARNEPFVLVMRSRGLTRRSVFLRYVLPNALVPTLTASGLILGQLLAGSVLVERVFNWPGAGALVTQGILQQDYAVVQTYILLSALVYVGASFLVDVTAAAIDPRLRSGASS